MTEIEKKALALLNGYHSPYHYLIGDHPVKVLCRAIEQHEAFRQEVSDAVESLCNTVLMSHGHRQLREMLSRRFIIAKPDPLVEAWIEATGNTVGMEPLNEAIAKRGGKIVWGEG